MRATSPVVSPLRTSASGVAWIVVRIPPLGLCFKVSEPTLCTSVPQCPCHEHIENQSDCRQHATEPLEREAGTVDFRPGEEAIGSRRGVAGPARLPAAILRGSHAARDGK